MERAASSAINLREKLGLFDELWAPRVVAALNDYQVKLVKLKGEFTWHAHEATDELFMVIDGEMRIEFRDRAVALKAGDLFVVPKGAEHRPRAESKCHVLLIEAAGVVNTGEAGGDLTARGEQWI